MELDDQILGGLSEASKLPGPKEQAWAMRHAFDKILDAMKQLVGEGEPSQSQPSQPQQGPVAPPAMPKGK